MADPVPIALIVCDNVYRERGGKTALVGLFNQIRAQRYPVVHGRMVVYASVTGVRDNTTFRLEIVNAETDHQVISMQGPAPEQTSPLSICDMIFELNNLRFPEAGTYYIRLWGNDTLMLQRPFELQGPTTEKREPS